MLVLLAVIGVVSPSRTLALSDDSLDQRVARAESAAPGDRPARYIQIAREQAETADKLYQAGNAEAGNEALKNAVTYAEKAGDAAERSGKRLKDTEIAVRKMAEKFRDVKHNLPFDDQAPVQDAVDRLEKMRTDLLAEMFGKKDKK
jgi:rubrerythrin